MKASESLAASAAFCGDVPMAALPGKLQVFFDGECPLCRREVRHYQGRDLEARIEWIDIARPGFDAAKYGLDPARVNAVMHARTAEGDVITEVAAFLRIWEALPPSVFTRVAGSVLKVPGMMRLAGVMYRMFARNRYRLTGRCAEGGCDVLPKG